MPDNTDGSIRPGDPPYSLRPQDGIREGEPPGSSPLISIPQSLLDADRAFRTQILALGAAWVLIGVVSALVLVSTLTGDWNRQANALRPVILFSSGLQVTWILIGVLTCLKKMWAVYCGLGLSYFVILSPVFCMTISIAEADLSILYFVPVSALSSLIFLLLIMQAHRVISLAKEGTYT